MTSLSHTLQIEASNIIRNFHIQFLNYAPINVMPVGGREGGQARGQDLIELPSCFSSNFFSKPISYSVASRMALVSLVW